MEHMKIFMQTDDENVDWEQKCFLLFTLDGFATGCEPFPLISALSQLINTCGAGQPRTHRPVHSSQVLRYDLSSDRAIF